jgi:hypothetical protein
MPHHTDSCQRSRIQETLCDTRYVTTSDQCQIWRDNTKNTNKKVSRHKIFCQNSLPDTQVPEHDSSKKCLRILRQGCVRPTSTYDAIRIAHSLVQSKSHQKRAWDQNRTLAGAIEIAPKASVRAESHTRWCNRNCTKSVKPTSTYVPNDRKDSRQSHETP